jgi:hypothetical protein
MDTEIPMSRVPGNVRVDCYAGYKGEESPRAVIIDGVRSAVVDIISRKRACDRAGRKMAEIWRCRLEDGREITVERLECGVWQVFARS